MLLCRVAGDSCEMPEVRELTLTWRPLVLRFGACHGAGIAQLVERNLAKVEVASSSLVSRSNEMNSILKPLRPSRP